MTCRVCGKTLRSRRVCNKCWLHSYRRKQGIKPRKVIHGQSISVRLPRHILDTIRHEAKAKNVYVADVIRSYLAKLYG